MQTYTPNVADEHSFKAYRDIGEAIALSRQHESYLTVNQLAMAIIVGLKKWGATSDAVLVARAILDLLGEEDATK